MQELSAWLTRLSEIEQSQTPPDLGESMKRLASPSPLSMSGIVRIVDSGRRVDSFGRMPAHLSVLCWLEENPRGQSLSNNGLATQLGAVLTLASNRRVAVASSDVTMTMEGTTSRTFLPTSHVIDGSLAGPLPDDMTERFNATVASVWGLDTDDLVAIGSAIELHYAATLLFDVDPNAAYALCVAGIERLSRSYGEPPEDWAGWEDAKRLDQVFSDQGLTGEQAKGIRAELLKNRHLRLRQTFAGYVVTSLPRTFWDEEVEQFVPKIRMGANGEASFEEMGLADPIPMERLVPGDPDELKGRMLRSYDARSSYVHEGRAREQAQSSVGDRLDTGAESRGPIEFAGLRRVLMRLILDETEERSKSKELPNLQHTDPGATNS